MKHRLLGRTGLYVSDGADLVTPIEETIRALDNLVSRGLVRYIGASNMSAWQIMRALGLSRQYNYARFETVQSYYTIAGRDLEREIIPMLNDQQLGLMVWSPLAGGWLTGGYRKNKDLPTSKRRTRMPARYDMSTPDNQRKLDAADALGQLADDAGLSLIHLALAFVIQHPAVTAPIIGPRTLEHLQSQIGAAEVKLSADVLDTIDDIVPPGVTISRSDESYQPPSLTDPFLRRRRTA